MFVWFLRLWEGSGVNRISTASWEAGPWQGSRGGSPGRGGGEAHPPLHCPSGVPAGRAAWAPGGTCLSRKGRLSGVATETTAWSPPSHLAKVSLDVRRPQTWQVSVWVFVGSRQLPRRCRGVTWETSGPKALSAHRAQLQLLPFPHRAQGTHQRPPS